MNWRLGVIAVSLLSCQTPQVKRAPAPQGVLRISCRPSDATIWVDEKLIGEVQDVAQGILLPVGSHRLEVRHDSHFSRYREFSIRPNETTSIDMTLFEVFD